jgi:hypothetical protein
MNVTSTGRPRSAASETGRPFSFRRTIGGAFFCPAAQVAAASVDAGGVADIGGDVDERVTKTSATTATTRSGIAAKRAQRVVAVTPQSYGRPALRPELPGLLKIVRRPLHAWYGAHLSEVFCDDVKERAGWRRTGSSSSPSWATIGAQILAALLVVGSYFAAEWIRVRAPCRRGEQAAHRSVEPVSL